MRVQCCPCRVCVELLTERFSLLLWLFCYFAFASVPFAYAVPSALVPASAVGCVCAYAGEPFPRTRRCTPDEFSDPDLAQDWCGFQEHRWAAGPPFR